MNTLDLTFTAERDTQNSRRYIEDVEDNPPMMATFKIKRWALERLGTGNLPNKLRVVITPICGHRWIVCRTNQATAAIMLECEVCEATGAVAKPTETEWGRAFYAPSQPYHWDGGDDRVTIWWEPPLQTKELEDGA